jgi:primosomal protein N'
MTECPNCDATMTVLRSANRIECKLCGYAEDKDKGDKVVSYVG